jgi:L-lactate dehydrogenase (cytochrome)
MNHKPDHAPASNDRIGRRSMASIPRRFRSILSLNDLEEAARRRLPRPLFGYVRGGVEDERAMRGNLASFEDYVFIPRFCAGVSGASSAVSLFGETWAAPFGIAPMGICAMNGYRADLAMAEAARDNEIPMIISGSSLIPLEKIVAANPRAWFQAYVPPTADKLEALLDRVKAAGIETLVITVDSPVGSNRENNLRAGFSSPLRPNLRLALDGLLRPRWLVRTFLRTLMTDGVPHFENLYAYRSVPIISGTVQREFGGRAHFNWESFRNIRQLWYGRLVIKGILHPADAALAVSAGADAIIVSNHGGRQLDAAVAPLHVLPSIVAAVGDVPVMLDGGVRRGTDVVKALGLGARFVFVGRPFNYAAAIGETAGVDYAISILKSEVVRSLAQIGVRSVEAIDRGQIVPRGTINNPVLAKDRQSEYRGEQVG